MPIALAPHSNKLRVGYAARWVFGGRGRGGLGKIRGGCIASGGLDWTDLGGAHADPVQAGGASVPPAACLQNQSLSGMALGVVARSASHGLGRMADLRAFGVPRRLIASLQTGHLGAVQRGPLGPAGGRGGIPPFAARSGPYARSERANRNLTNSGRPFVPPFTGSGPGLQGARNLSRWPTGSGVRGSAPARELGAETRGNLRSMANRVGDDAHLSIDLGESETLGGRAT